MPTSNCVAIGVCLGTHVGSVMHRKVAPRDRTKIPCLSTAADDAQRMDSLATKVLCYSGFKRSMSPTAAAAHRPSWLPRSGAASSSCCRCFPPSLADKAATAVRDATDSAARHWSDSVQLVMLLRELQTMTATSPGK